MIGSKNHLTRTVALHIFLLDHSRLNPLQINQIPKLKREWNTLPNSLNEHRKLNTFLLLIFYSILILFWSCKPEFKSHDSWIIAESGLILRTEPSTESKALVTIPFGTRLYLLERSKNESEVIDRETKAKYTNYWYKVSYLSKVGWIFGTFLDSKENYDKILRKKRICDFIFEPFLNHSIPLSKSSSIQPDIQKKFGAPIATEMTRMKNWHEERYNDYFYTIKYDGISFTTIELEKDNRSFILSIEILDNKIPLSQKVLINQNKEDLLNFFGNSYEEKDDEFSFECQLNYLRIAIEKNLISRILIQYYID